MNRPQIINQVKTVNISVTFTPSLRPARISSWIILTATEKYTQEGNGGSA